MKGKFLGFNNQGTVHVEVQEKDLPKVTGVTRVEVPDGPFMADKNLMVHVARHSDRDDYCTPPDLFDKIDKIFKFEYDMACTPANSLCRYNFKDSLQTHWTNRGRIWCNPPFSNKEAFLKKAVEARRGNDVIVFIVPNNARATEWWRTYALQADIIVNLFPRVNYYLDGKEAKGVAFDSCLLIYYPRISGIDYGVPKEVYWRWRG